MKTLASLLLLWLSLGRFCNAQFVDTFSDSNFHAAPAWMGDSSHFTVNAQRQLQLLAPSGSTRSLLHTASQAIHAASWEWWSRLEFNPSSTNYADVYVVSDQAHLDGPLNGYFVRIGNTTDEVSLYRQTGSTRTKIIDGRDGLLNRNNNLLKVKVERNAQGVWQLWADSSGSGQHYVLEGTASDLVHPNSSWFGLRLVYTATRADKFYFDDFEVMGSGMPDTIAPQITRSRLLGDRAWELKFSEWPRANELLHPASYQLVGFGSPLGVTPGADTSIYLEWLQPFASPALLELDVRLSDSAGNVLDTTLQILNRQLQRGDVVINEFMADPSPVIALPETEFVELHNTTDFPINIGGWLLSDPGTAAELPAYVIPPKSFVLLVPSNALNLWTGYGPVLPVQPWPSLNNDQDRLRLSNRNGLVLDSVYYHVSWLGNVVKQQGGWTYERVSPSSSCIDSSNWKASQHPNGGSPGQANSIHGSPVPPAWPHLLYAYWLNSDSVLLQFSHAVLPGWMKIEEDTSLLNLNTQFSPQWRLPITAAATSRNSVSLTIGDWYDCHGQVVQTTHYRIGKGSAPKANALIFNEIYYRPNSAGTSYFELLNASDQLIDLSKVLVSSANTDWLPSQAVVLSTWPLVIFPGQYIVFCRDTLALRRDFGSVPLENRFQMSSWPTINQSGGRLLLLDQAGSAVDRLLFHDSLHHPLLRDTRGMALERLEGSPTSNFSSAQSSVRGTPGLKNSRITWLPTTKAGWRVEPQLIRPEAFERMHIQYVAKGPQMLKIEVLDLGGKSLGTLLPLQLCHDLVEIIWDGTLQGRSLQTGAYLLQASYYEETGEAGRLMERIVVSRLRP
ncbi:MAG: lamin tail domain-containing protein [Sphingobacteriaceae bacterium]|nr:lamin tail domain-containing protein [Sphingobacteriaceae bacterium]